MKTNYSRAIRAAVRLTLLAAVFSTTQAATPYTYAAIEQAIIQEHNLARMEPDRYASEIAKLLPRFDDRLMHLPNGNIILTTEGAAAVEEAVRFMRAQAPLNGVQESDGMSSGARDHVRDQGPTGAIGHDGSDGSHVWDRANRHGTWVGQIGENISYGPSNARQVVIGLIVDDAVPGRGHRENIFTPEYAVVGVACGPHERYGTMCVIDYADGFEEATGN